MKNLFIELKYLNKLLLTNRTGDHALYYQGLMISNQTVLITLFLIILARSVLGFSWWSGSFLLAFGWVISRLMLKVFRILKDLKITRTAPKQGREGKNDQFNYHLITPKEQLALVVTIHDFYSGYAERHFSIQEFHYPGQSQIKKNITHNNGMGSHTIGPMLATVTDLDYLVETTSFYGQSQNILVYPHIEQMRRIAMYADALSFLPGMNELFRRGDSQIFRGLRDFKSGDTQKLINWKLTAKHRHLLVNEYEKSVNSHIKIILDLEPILHFGLGHNSSWELIKDLTLALIAQCTEGMNQISLITQQGFFGPGTGQAYQNDMEMVMPGLLPIFKNTGSDPKKNNSSHLVKKALTVAGPGESIIYIAPFQKSKLLLENLERLGTASKQFENPIRVFLLDSLDLLAMESKQTGNQGMLAFVQIARELKKEWEKNPPFGLKLHILDFDQKILRQSIGKITSQQRSAPL